MLLHGRVQNSGLHRVTKPRTAESNIKPGQPPELLNEPKSRLLAASKLQEKQTLVAKQIKTNLYPTPLVEELL